uniref:Secreted protein n=1 Tax=Cacopsylla melanoneura TaxID=428564 RepID=A0A8D8LZ35_9HEMI
MALNTWILNNVNVLLCRELLHCICCHHARLCLSSNCHLLCCGLSTRDTLPSLRHLSANHSHVTLRITQLSVLIELLRKLCSRCCCVCCSLWVPVSHLLVVNVRELRSSVIRLRRSRGTRLCNCRIILTFFTPETLDGMSIDLRIVY